MICCGGVLHHLPDPAAGLRALRSVLKQGGVLQLATYSTIGTSTWRKVREKKQTAFWGPCSFLVMKTITLPRQARDKTERKETRPH
jgi:2-polyprenyl-3-methyl-5-hydroxy-6-metoxy-1,4-benzoquinol methylase